MSGGTKAKLTGQVSRVEEIELVDVTTVLGPEEEKRLVRKIDRNILPLLFVTYGLDFLDKTALSYSAVLGLIRDLHLKGNEYSWCSSIFWVGYLVGSYPISLGFVKFPLGKYLSLLTLAWGVTLTLHAVAHHYAGLMVLRALLGVFECGMGPGFTLITGMWYTPREHSLRHCAWFAGNPSASVIGAMIAYGVLHYRGTYPPWGLLFLVIGLMTIVWCFILLCFLPDSPKTAHFLTATEREFASLRPKKFQHTTQTRKWSSPQFVETFCDVKTWWFLVFAVVFALPNAGITNFATLIIKSFGFTTSQTILMTIPPSVFQLTTIVLAAFITTKIRNARLLVISTIYLLGIAGVLMIKLIPDATQPGDTSHHDRLTRLAGFWVITCTAPAFPLQLALFNSNTAGFTKKATVLALITVMFCAGSLAGPQFFIDSEAPGYKTAYTTILICFALTTLMPLLLRVHLERENRRRNKAAQRGESGSDLHLSSTAAVATASYSPEEHRDVDLNVDGAVLESVDETDWENREFRYVL